MFCERESGAARFQVHADQRGKIPEEEAAALLAMHCLVRGRSPGDYRVMVDAGEDLLRGVTSRAATLLRQGRASFSPIRLTRREQEVFAGVARNLANKEIAAQLRLSERTVKFHISALFAKFGVHDRVSLMLEATNVFLPATLPAATPDPPSTAAQPGAAHAQPVTAEAGPPPSAARVLRLPRRTIGA